MAPTVNDNSITSESAPLMAPVDGESDQGLFMVPLKRPSGPSPRLPPSRYRNVKARSPPRSPILSPRQRSSLGMSPQPGQNANPYQSPAMSGCTVKPETPPMFGSPLMSPDSGMASGSSPDPQGSASRRSMATPRSLSHNNSPDMTGGETKAGASPVMSAETGSARPSPQPETSGNGQATITSASRTEAASRASADKTDPSTKPSSLSNSSPRAITHHKPETPRQQTHHEQAQRPPPIPPLSSARNLGNRPPPTANVGLALTIDPAHGHLLGPPTTTPNDKSAAAAAAAAASWTAPDSPAERLSQMRATADSAYDRARQMEVRRSEWKHVVYRFAVRGGTHWVIDADLTESSHARLAEVARRSSEGFAFNGDGELAGIYRVLAGAHARV
ncbi:hypothetical protein BT67DRAFT_485148, partial [Trichocladium antarcticum]